MQNEITQPLELLDENGHITEPGWARRPYWRYDRAGIKAPWYRIKEWDYYAVYNNETSCWMTFTLADLGFAGIAAVAFIDFNKKSFVQVDDMKLLTKGKMGFPPTSEEGEICFTGKKIRLTFNVQNNVRTITVNVPGFPGTDGRRGLNGTITLSQNPDMDTMVIATSWKENRKAFYYNEKINCMPAQGLISIGDSEFRFSQKNDLGTLDWGRGNWTYKNRWYWGSASGYIHNSPFGFNIGYGFSDRSPATENIIFHRGKGHKLDEVTFHMDVKNYLKPWKFSSSDGRFELQFEPFVDRYSSFNLLIIKSIQHQVFGYFSGPVILDNGDTLYLDRFPGFAEDVLNWW